MGRTSDDFEHLLSLVTLINSYLCVFLAFFIKYLEAPIFLLLNIIKNQSCNRKMLKPLEIPRSDHATFNQTQAGATVSLKVKVQYT